MRYSLLPHTAKLPQKFTRHWPDYFLLLCFIINLWLLWPGIMTPDSYAQYQEALTNTYYGAHPPLMGWFWHWLLKLQGGPGLILIWHLALLYGACGVFRHALVSPAHVTNPQDRPNTNPTNSYVSNHTEPQIWVKYYYLILPLWPAISFYSGMIWKDVSLALSWLAFSSGLTYLLLRQPTPRWYQVLILISLLFYGAAVKFQALYIAPPLVFGLCLVINNFKINMRTWGLAGLGYLGLWWGVQTVNYALVTPSPKQHWWQYVKIYDLAGISVQLNRPLFPVYILQAPQFSFQAVQQKFNYERVDDLVFFPNSPIITATHPPELAILNSYWRRTVWQYPAAYLKHRWHNWQQIICAKPLEKLATLDLAQFRSAPWLTCLKQPLLITLKYIRYGLSFIWVFITLLLLLIFGCANLTNPYGLLLTIFSSTSLGFVLALFPCTMASALRYVYLPVCLTCAMLPLAYQLYRTRR